MNFIRMLKTNAGKLKTEITALSFAVKDKRTPAVAKLLIIITIAYALSPIDLIPDFIPVLGYLDDLILLPLLILLSIKLIPPDVLQQCREMAGKERLRSKKTGIIVAAVIIVFWIALVAVMIRWIMNLM